MNWIPVIEDMWRKKKMNKETEHKRIDWIITLVPLGIVIVLCSIFFLAPERSNVLLGQIPWEFII